MIPPRSESPEPSRSAAGGIADRIREALEQTLDPVALVIEDESARHAGHAGAREGGHFRIRIISERFRGLGPLARHRMVYGAVGPLLRSGVHALAIEARSPEEITS